MKNHEFKSERSDINRMINHHHDLFALVLLFRGRANDCDEQLQRSPLKDIGEVKRIEGKRDAYHRCANDLKMALRVIYPESNFDGDYDKDESLSDD